MTNLKPIFVKPPFTISTELRHYFASIDNYNYLEMYGSHSFMIVRHFTSNASLTLWGKAS